MGYIGNMKRKWKLLFRELELKGQGFQGCGFQSSGL